MQQLTLVLLLCAVVGQSFAQNLDNLDFLRPKNSFQLYTEGHFMPGMSARTGLITGDMQVNQLPTLGVSVGFTNRSHIKQSRSFMEYGMNLSIYQLGHRFKFNEDMAFGGVNNNVQQTHLGVGFQVNYGYNIIEKEKFKLYGMAGLRWQYLEPTGLSAGFGFRGEDFYEEIITNYTSVMKSPFVPLVDLGLGVSFPVKSKNISSIRLGLHCTMDPLNNQGYTIMNADQFIQNGTGPRIQTGQARGVLSKLSSLGLRLGITF